MNNERKERGVVIGWVVEESDLLLRVKLSGPLSKSDLGEARIGDFRNDTPLGFKVLPRFDDGTEGDIVMISVLQAPAVNPEIFAINGPKFVDQKLTTPQ